MTTDFDIAAADMIGRLKQRLGIVVIYNGAPITALNVIYGQSSAGTVHAQTAEIEVDAVDVPEPAYRDEVLINGASWRVHRNDTRGLAITGDGYCWKIPLVRDERARARNR